jgi:hypothetical protein
VGPTQRPQVRGWEATGVCGLSLACCQPHRGFCVHCCTEAMAVRHMDLCEHRGTHLWRLAFHRDTCRQHTLHLLHTCRQQMPALEPHTPCVLLLLLLPPSVCGRLAPLLMAPTCCWTTHWRVKWTKGCWGLCGTASCRCVCVWGGGVAEGGGCVETVTVSVVCGGVCV